MKAALLVSHGSRSKEALDEIKVLTEHLRSQSSLKVVRYAFLDVEEPTIEQGIQDCIDRGATEILILLHFLNSGNHVKLDIPEIINAARQKHAGVIFHLTAPIGLNPMLEECYLKLMETSF